MHIGKYFGYIFHGAGRVLFYPKHAKKYIKNKDNYPLEERYDFVKNKIREVMDRILRIKIETKGMEKLRDDETYLFVPNHQSMLDPLSLIYIFDKPTIFVSKKEIEKFPIVGKIDYIIDSYFLDRESPREALKMVKTCQNHLLNNTNVVIFAEGTRSKNEEVSIQEYKAGSFKCVYNTEAKVVPVVIDKSYIPLSTKYKNADNIIQVSFLDPIDKNIYEKMSTSELANMVNELAKKELSLLRNSNK